MSKLASGPARNFAIESPFGRLAELLDDIEPEAAVIDLSVGGPRHPMPDFLIEKLAEAADDFGRYPAIGGTDDFREAVSEWLARRYSALRGAVDAEHDILPLCGTREGLFSAVIPAVQRKADTQNPAVLIPNPFYQTYAAGALVAGAEPIYLPADARSGFLPCLEALDDALLARTAVMFICSPANPQGAVADEAYLSQAINLARSHDFLLFADECYSEIYTGRPPPGALAASHSNHGDFRNVVGFQSLSKRSNLPGLRSGFCAGDADFIAALAKLRNVTAPQLALPIQHASSAIWRDEAHVEENRALYRAKFEIADEILGKRFGYRRPQGGFFLWLDVSEQGGGERVAKTLWKDCGVKILPGSFLAQTGNDGANPGSNHIRVAMVAGPEETTQALTRIVARLG
ncbi:MAG: aminotransferase class I/II-fold pyridoxal phosphate-dependent enzyme [Hyphomicrobiales bacterium]|nr:aminotransferase class I/II-fold pyridoxal phosphate-dependent enzyme [Hyphomicrobiales bacterium]